MTRRLKYILIFVASITIAALICLGYYIVPCHQTLEAKISKCLKDIDSEYAHDEGDSYYFFSVDDVSIILNIESPDYIRIGSYMCLVIDEEDPALYRFLSDKSLRVPYANIFVDDRCLWFREEFCLPQSIHVSELKNIILKGVESIISLTTEIENHYYDNTLYYEL